MKITYMSLFFLFCATVFDCIKYIVFLLESFFSLILELMLFSSILRTHIYISEWGRRFNVSIILVCSSFATNWIFVFVLIIVCDCFKISPLHFWKIIFALYFFQDELVECPSVFFNSEENRRIWEQKQSSASNLEGHGRIANVRRR